MKKLKYNPLPSLDQSYSGDVKRIVEAFAEAGYEVSEHDAERAWAEYSNSFCAGWLELPDFNEDIVDYLMDFMVEV